LLRLVGTGNTVAAFIECFRSRYGEPQLLKEKRFILRFVRDIVGEGQSGEYGIVPALDSDEDVDRRKT
jgi:hypothetical protein